MDAQAWYLATIVAVSLEVSGLFGPPDAGGFQGFDLRGPVSLIRLPSSAKSCSKSVRFE
jgi:hypothetical protein